MTLTWGIKTKGTRTEYWMSTWKIYCLSIEKDKINNIINFLIICCLILLFLIVIVLCAEKEIFCKKKRKKYGEKRKKGNGERRGGKARKEGRHVNIVDLSSINSSTLYFFLSFTLKWRWSFFRRQYFLLIIKILSNTRGDFETPK